MEWSKGSIKIYGRNKFKLVRVNININFLVMIEIIDRIRNKK